MTAIIRIFTPDGFVVAADGRKLDPRNGTVESDEVQKIFPLRHVSGLVAASICGIGGLALDGGITLDLRSVLCNAAIAVQSRNAFDLHAYANLLVAEIDPLVRSFQSTTIPTSRDTGTSLLLDGLLYGMPARETITITYGSTGTDVRTVQEWPLLSVKGYVSEKIWQMLCDDSSEIAGWLSPYRSVYRRLKTPRTLTEATELAVAIIKAHCEPEAGAIDPEFCRTIGGRIHIGTLTPARGFEWVSGFEQGATHVFDCTDLVCAHVQHRQCAHGSEGNQGVLCCQEHRATIKL